MKLFKSKEENLIHYVTAVTYSRVPLFRIDALCELFIQALTDTRLKDRFKLIGYVLMPDHFHLLANPVGRSAAQILKFLRVNSEVNLLTHLRLPRALASGQTHAAWLKDFSSIDIWSPKFVRQKLSYIHMNPVRAGLCDHPAKWRWSSYHAYLPHKAGEVPIEVDWRWMWTADEFANAADESAV